MHSTAIVWYSDNYCISITIKLCHTFKSQDVTHKKVMTSHKKVMTYTETRCSFCWRTWIDWEMVNLGDVNLSQTQLVGNLFRPTSPSLKKINWIFINTKYGCEVQNWSDFEFQPPVLKYFFIYGSPWIPIVLGGGLVHYSDHGHVYNHWLILNSSHDLKN